MFKTDPLDDLTINYIEILIKKNFKNYKGKK